MTSLDEIQKFRILNKLKNVYRSAPVYDSGRKESTAEHTWSSLMLADLLLPLIKQPIDKLKVFELIMYHDIVEIEVGDYGMKPTTNHKDKSEEEWEGAIELNKKLPEAMQKKYLELFKEYEEGTTLEGAFAKCIDLLDASINFLDYKEMWAPKGWKSEHLISKKKTYFEKFSELNALWEEFLQWTINEGYLEE